MIFATVNSKSQKWHLTFCSCGIIENMWYFRFRFRFRFKIHNDFYIDTVVQSQSTILNTNTIDSEEVYAGLLSYFVNVLMKTHCIMFIIVSLIHPYFPIFFTRNNKNFTSGPPNYIWRLLQGNLQQGVFCS